MGKIEIDYNILHDAFFKFQRTPKLTKHGQIYKEGSENEIKREGVMAGRLSPSLLDALGIASQCPPPWILNMQKYGPPPGYPTLKIPGVNMPIPSHIKMDLGGLFSDERGNTVYADCHGLNP
jgi:splicing factor 3B subunit 2